ncbi:16S rRNA (cytidine(1402)-2'-O)-methyltransferase [Myxosarcina sp. GI1]|uniref:16S rRNA (cytidine(1402)-2'-O)-methyltransferase n=1 Tax=Myxosarcina sp. GI1 TaxID=1541065 RepID=UPI003527E584
MMEDLSSGILYLVGTPIGNLEDITLRAIRILQQVDTIAAEDTRRTGKLLQHLQIDTPQISYYEHNHSSRIENLLARLRQGAKIALVTDAGMPSISDPGYELVREAIANSVTVVPIPGVTAAVCALAASGLPTYRFVFEGFLPQKNKFKKERLDALQSETRTTIFYEAPHRLQQTLKDLGASLGIERQIVIARELTKIHEEFWRGSINEAIALYETSRQPKGEYTLVVAGAIPEVAIATEAELITELEQLLKQGMTRSQASSYLAKISNFSRRKIYKLAVEIVS